MGLREAEPAKMTSIISLPRRLLLERSPRTHLMASTTLDLPQPLGPTTPVTSSSKENSVRSAKDLKPLSVSLARRISSQPPCRGGPCRAAPLGARDREPGPASCRPRVGAGF